MPHSFCNSIPLLHSLFEVQNIPTGFSCFFCVIPSPARPNSQKRHPHSIESKNPQGITYRLWLLLCSPLPLCLLAAPPLAARPPAGRLAAFLAAAAAGRGPGARGGASLLGRRAGPCNPPFLIPLLLLPLLIATAAAILLRTGGPAPILLRRLLHLLRVPLQQLGVLSRPAALFALAPALDRAAAG